MDFVIGAISIISLVLNYIIYRQVSVRKLVPATLEEFELPVYNCQCVFHGSCCEEEKQQEPEKDVGEYSSIPNPPPQVDTNSYSPWKNQKDIPWSAPAKAPEPSIKAPERGPLARPDGFV